MKNTEKIAVISIDVEDWYHLDYIPSSEGNGISMLDGFDRFIEICTDENIPATYFCLSDLVTDVSDRFEKIIAHGGEVAMHGTDHQRPLSQSLENFVVDTTRGKNILQDALGIPIEGYRAPCFSLDRERLDALIDVKFKYDSSKIDFGSHPLYGNLDIEDFERLDDLTYCSSQIFEFEIPTFKKFGGTLPISGGGYIRILPWVMLKSAILSYIREHTNFFVFMHPFELSNVKAPKNLNLKALTNFRFRYGISRTPSRFSAIIHMLKREGYAFKTFSELRKHHIGNL